MTTKWFPTLFKKSSTGAIQQWDISVTDSTITTIHGQVGGKLQTTIDGIKAGKNLGKANATTKEQQAVLEAEAKWTKQLKKGYVESVEDAAKGKVDKIIEGGVSPMLAHKFRDHAHKIAYPAYAQPKLDGIRCIAIVKDGKCTLWSRTRKPITGVPHIQRALAANLPLSLGGIVLDGELYRHDYKDNFEEIVSIVRQETPKEGHEVVQYHVYDTVTDWPFSQRTRELRTIIPRRLDHQGPIKFVETREVASEEELQEYFEKCLEEGYEGAMVRNAAGQYLNKRSYDLQKLKSFEDSEFEIVDVEEGRGKLAGHAIFVCQTSSGERFRVKMKGETSKLRTAFLEPAKWIGQQLTVRYQGMTNKNGVPRFPVGTSLRNYE